jgi:predicted ATPase
MHATAFALQGELLIREGETEPGVALLRSAVATLRADRQVLLLAGAICSLAEGLIAQGQLDEALALVDTAIADVHEGAETSHLPELLRIQSEVLVAIAHPDESRAEEALKRSLGGARQQGALAWELRTAMTLARLRVRQGRGDEGRQLLSSVYARFAEGFETDDLKAARQLLQALG